MKEDFIVDSIPPILFGVWQIGKLRPKPKEMHRLAGELSSNQTAARAREYTALLKIMLRE